jgi:hypothetical protein
MTTPDDNDRIACENLSTDDDPGPLYGWPERDDLTDQLDPPEGDDVGLGDVLRPGDDA